MFARYDEDRISTGTWDPAMVTARAQCGAVWATEWKESEAACFVSTSKPGLR